MNVDVLIAFTVVNGVFALLNLVKPVVQLFASHRLLEQRVLHLERWVQDVQDKIEEG